MTDIVRCIWPKNPLAIQYHDEEWGVPVHDDHKLFEAFILGGAQAGLSWDTVLRKREHYRAVYEGFDPESVARFDDAKIQALLADPGIIRNRLKVLASVESAKAFLKVQEAFGSFDAYLWRFVDGRPVINHCRPEDPYRVTSPESDALSRDLKKRGFKFVGSTICYATMQGIGMVNDHHVTCFRYAPLCALS
jgi:DNA-3-methyladenine glycosylase I